MAMGAVRVVIINNRRGILLKVMGADRVIIVNNNRLMDNWNSIKLFTEKNQERILIINETRKRYNSDIMVGCEPQVDWSMADSEHQFYELFGSGEPKKGKAA